VEKLAPKLNTHQKSTPEQGDLDRDAWGCLDWVELNAQMHACVHMLMEVLIY
jgi:hypothetical protein